MFCFALTIKTLLDIDTTVAPTLPPTTTDAPTLPPTTTAPPGIVKRLHVYIKDKINTFDRFKPTKIIFYS